MSVRLGCCWLLVGLLVTHSGMMSAVRAKPPDLPLDLKVTCAPSVPPGPYKITPAEGVTSEPVRCEVPSRPAKVKPVGFPRSAVEKILPPAGTEVSNSRSGQKTEPLFDLLYYPEPVMLMSETVSEQDLSGAGNQNTPTQAQPGPR